MMMISLTETEEYALIKTMWNIQDDVDNAIVDLILKNMLFQICNYCHCMPVKDCSTNGCYLLKNRRINVFTNSQP